MARRVLIAAGGTGGHFYPGLALAETLRERGWQPVFLVRRGDRALPALEARGLPSVELDLSGLPRRPGLDLLGYPFRLGRALSVCSAALRDLEARAAVGMGGYLGFPLALAACWRGVPSALHESNAVPGLANRLAARLGARLFWGLPPEAGPEGELVGTPIRRALWERREAAAARRALGLDPDGPVLLVFGGSQGARGLNRAAPRALAELARAAPGRLQALHLAGPDAAEVARAYEGLPLRARVLPFLEEMEHAYGAADLALCRAGASTLAELAAQRVPALLVPYPHAAGDHQDANARALKRAGAARRLPEAELDGLLAGALKDLLVSPEAPERRRAMSEAYARLGLPAPAETAARLADRIERLARA